MTTMSNVKQTTVPKTTITTASTTASSSLSSSSEIAVTSQNNSDDGSGFENESSFPLPIDQVNSENYDKVHNDNNDCDDNINGHEEENNDGDSVLGSEFYLRLSDLSQEFSKPFHSSTRLRRLRYTCCDVSPNVTPLIVSPARFAALGTTAGSVYLFELFQNNSDDSKSFTTEHRSTLICEDLIGAVSALQFAPVQLYFDNQRPAQVTNNSTNRNSSGGSSSNNNQNHSTTVNHNKSSTNTSGESELSCNSGNSDNYRQTIASPLTTPMTMGASTASTGKIQPRRASIDISRASINTSSTGKTTVTATNNNNLRNIFLAIGGTKGDLLLIEFDPKFVPNPPNNVRNVKKQWNVVYKNNRFTKNSISILRWDNSERLYIADNCGQLFILHDVLEYRQMLILSSPTLLINLNGLKFQQIDVAEKLLIFTTDEQRVFLLDMESSTLSQVGRQQKPKKKNGEQANNSSGVCVLANYRLVELSNYFHDDFIDSNRTSTTDNSMNSVATRAFRLVNTECQLFATRPKYRLWHIDQSGDVQFTHQFMELIQTSLQTNIVQTDNSINLLAPEIGNNETVTNSSLSTESLTGNFANLYPLYWRNIYADNEQECISSFVVTWIQTSANTVDQNSVLIIDPNQQIIVACSPPLKGQIIELKCVGNGVFIFYRVHDDSSTLLRVAFMELCIREPPALGLDDEHYDNHSPPESLSSSLSLYSSDYLADRQGNHRRVVDYDEDDVDGDDEADEEAVVYYTAEIHPDLQEAFNIFEQFRYDFLPAPHHHSHHHHQHGHVHRNHNNNIIYGASQSCDCNLPLRDCITPQDMYCVINKSNILNNLQNNNILQYLLKISFQNGHWPLVLLLAVKIGAVRFYLLIVTLIDCDFLFERLLFGTEQQREKVWKIVFDDLFDLLFGEKKLNDIIQISGDESTLQCQVDLYCNVSQKAQQYTCDPVIDPKCSLCNITSMVWSNVEHSDIITKNKVHWLESSYLSRALSFCSTEFVRSIVQQIITKLGTMKQQSPFHGRQHQQQVQCYFTTQFFLHIYRYEVMRLSVLPSTKRIIHNFSTSTGTLTLP